METFWAILAFVCLTILAFFSKLIIHQKPQPKIPPGPKPWPIIGNLNLLGFIPHQSLHVLSQKYGEIMHLKLGSCPVIVASSPEMAKLFLHTHDSTFASRPLSAAGKYTTYNYSDVVWAPYGPYLRQVRKIFFTKIFNPKRLELSEHIRAEERNVFISRLYALSGKPVVLRHQLRSYTLSSTLRMVLGDKYLTIFNPDDDSIISFEEFTVVLDRLFSLNGVFNIGDWIPWLNFLDLQGYIKQMKDVSKRMDQILNYVVDDHIAKRNGEENDASMDMVDILLQSSEDPNFKVKLTKDCIKALIQDLLGGGTDTSAVTIEWAMNELLKQPNIIEKATEELDRVIGRSRWVEENDFANLLYIDAIVKETFRLHPVGTLLSPRYAMEDCKVAGYDISKGTIVMINTWSIGRNPKYWNNSPEIFLPERFLNKNVDIKGHNFNILPFGSGRRMCPGYTLGLKIVFMGIANLLHGFNWKLPEGMMPEDICMDELFGLTTHPKIPLAAVMEPRLPNHLYKSLP